MSALTLVLQFGSVGALGAALSYHDQHSPGLSAGVIALFVGIAAVNYFIMWRAMRGFLRTYHLDDPN